MTREEMNEVWQLLGTYRRGDAKLGDKQLFKAWCWAFYQYPAEAVKSAVMEHFRRCHFWPDISEIAALCPDVVQDESLSQADQEQAKAIARYHQLLRIELDKLGLPTGLEAEAQGISYPQWRRMAEEAGVDFSGLVMASLTRKEALC